MKKTEFECFMEGMKILEKYARVDTYIWGRSDDCRLDNFNKVSLEDLDQLNNLGFWLNTEEFYSNFECFCF